MSLWVLLYLTIAAMVARQLFVLGAVLRSRRFLQNSQEPSEATDQIGEMPIFYVVIPVLREAAGLQQAIAHFEALAERHDAQVLVVTTARETAEADHHPEAGDTVAVAEELGRDSKSIHLHCPDPQGFKADQVNFAVNYCLASLLGDVPPQRAFLVIYDADSRPPLDSLACFEQAIARNPGISVFHQSSRFELRGTSASSNSRALAWLWRTVSDSGALRANRFVLGYEIPRLLNRSNLAGALKRCVYSYIYAHVTGHGLCVRLSLLREFPFPARSPLEDMHYSFLLGSRNLHMMPIASLDSANVPDSVRVQFQQLVRWFFGPAQFLRYLTDPATQCGWRARLLAVSAAGITAGWVSCAILPVLLAMLLWSGDGVTRTLIGLLVTAYAAQLVVVDYSMGSQARLAARAGRLLIYPVTCTLFGVAGLVGLGQLVRGGSGAGKTEGC